MKLPVLPILCTDARLGSRDDDGVSQYSRELIAAMRIVDPATLSLHDRFTVSGRSKTTPERWRRWLRTRIHPGVVPVKPISGHRLVGGDIYRRINVHFDRFGESLVLDAPGIAPGIVHWSYPMPVRLRGWTNLYTIHDTVPLDHSTLTEIDGARHERVLRAIVAHAAAITTVSAAARDDIVRTLGLDPGLVHDTGQSVTPAAPGTLPSMLASGDYYLFCGRIQPRKNIDRLVAAWRRSGARRRLVLVGPGQAQSEDRGVVILPAQTAATLSALQAGARALVFPSLAEGFGRPIAEAMTLGTAVLTSRGHATQEISGGAALLVDPLDVADIASAIARLDRDDALVAALATAGAARAAAFTRQTFADRLARLYASLVVNAPTPPYSPTRYRR